MDDLVQHLQVTTTTYFSPRGVPTPATQYSYYLGSHGPFTDMFTGDSDTPEAVNAAVQKRIEKLRAIGALPPG